MRGFENANSMMPYYYSESIVLKDKEKKKTIFGKHTIIGFQEPRNEAHIRLPKGCYREELLSVTCLEIFNICRCQL